MFISPIGELTEQLFENILVKGADLPIKDQLKINIEHNYSNINELYQNLHLSNNTFEKIEFTYNSLKHDLINNISLLNFYEHKNSHKENETYRSINELFNNTKEQNWGNFNLPPVRSNSNDKNIDIYHSKITDKKAHEDAPNRLVYYDKKDPPKRSRMKLTQLISKILNKLSKVTLKHQRRK